VYDEEIESTAHHPYWVVKGNDLPFRPVPDHAHEVLKSVQLPGRWVDAIHLQVGDVLLLKSGRQLAITALEVRRLADAVYNFHVADVHSYAVGACEVLVHNVDCPLGVPGPDFTPSKKVTAKYKRPKAAGPTRAQKKSVQGKPCAACGKRTKKQVADHKKALAVQHYETGKVNVENQSKVKAVQPHCPNCSAKQGGFLAGFVNKMNKLLGF